MRKAIQKRPLRREPVRSSPFGFGRSHLMTVVGQYVDLDEIEWLPNALEEKWARCLAVEMELRQQWHADQLKHVAEVGLLVAADQQAAALEKLRVEQDEKLRQDALRDQALVDRYMAAVKEAVAKIADRKYADRVARLRKATKQIDRDIVAAERKKFGIKSHHS